MNITENYIHAKGPEDFYAYRLGLQVQAYGGAIIIALGIVCKHDPWLWFWIIQPFVNIQESRVNSLAWW